MTSFSKKAVEKKMKNLDKTSKRKDVKGWKLLFYVIGKMIKYLLTFLLIAIIGCSIIFFVLYYKFYPTYLEYRNDAIETVENSDENTFSQNLNSYIYDDSGNLLGKLSSGNNSDYLDYEEIPEDVINAYVAVEDRTFWEHKGIDISGMIRVCYRYVITLGDEMHGASTITQQLARSTFLTNEVSLERKAKEILIALELEKKYTKEEILEYYINNTYYANRYYGIEAAAKGYFSKSVSKLNLSEIAYLCAIPNSPTYYDPLKNPDNAIGRRDKILEDMYECGYITEEEYTEAIEYEIVLNPQETTEIQNYEMTYAIDCAIRYLMAQDGFEFQYTYSSTSEYNEYLENYNTVYEEYRDKLYTGGYTVHTSLNQEIQDLLQTTIDEKMAFDEEVNEEGTYALQSASTIIDNNTHKVVAIVGGRSQDTDTYTLNRAYQSYRQPGSTFKPLIVYTPALEAGYTANSVLYNIDVTKAKEKGADATTMTGTEYTLRSAVEQSKNGCAWYLLANLTVNYGMKYVTNMEFTKIVPDDYYLSASLGGLTYGVTTVEMAAAYSTLANGGEFNSATCITSIIDKDGNEIYEESESKQVYSAGAASSMVDILKGVITRGTASSMKWSLKVDAAGKTGTTNDSKDGWFCGITPDYSMSVWVGYDEPKTLSNLYGSTYPASIWKTVMSELVADTENTEFKEYESDDLTISSLGAQDYYSYLPGRDDDEVLSSNYTVKNYREDHILADSAEELMHSLQTLDPNSDTYEEEGLKLYTEARTLVNQIYSRNLYAEEEEKLQLVYEEYQENCNSEGG